MELPTLLPPGWSIEEQGAVAWPVPPDDVALGAYRSVVEPGDNLLVSRYYLRAWLPVMGGDLWALVPLLNDLAEQGGRDASLPLADLGAALKRSEDKMRDLRKWLMHPQPHDLRWLAARAYIRRIGPHEGGRRRGSPLWEWCVLRGDVLHPMHLPTYFEALRNAPAVVQRALLLDEGRKGGEVRGVVQWSEIPTLVRRQGWEKATLGDSASCQGSEIATLDGLTGGRLVAESPEERQQGSEIPTLVAAHDHDAEDLDLSDRSRIEEAASLLERLGCGLAYQARLLGLDRGAAGVLEWGPWVEHLKRTGKLRSADGRPEGYLWRAVSGFCAGDARYQHAPTADEVRQASGLVRAAVRKAAAPAVPDSLRAPWAALLSAIGNEALRGLVAGGVPIGLEGGTLLVRVSEASGVLLRRRSKEVAAAVATVDGVDQVRFTRGDGGDVDGG